MIIRNAVSKDQQDSKRLDFQEDLDRGFDYLLTDLLARVADLERKEASQNERGDSD